MIVDCFSFFNEFDLLEIRLRELSDIVDVFVLSEATMTFSGKSKPLYFNENKLRFKSFANRIEHVIIDNYDGIDTSDSWSMDRGQRQIALDVMTSRLNPRQDDVVIVSDCDEIPRAEIIKEAIRQEWGIARLQMPLFYYYLNCVCINTKWNHPKLVRPKGRLKYRRLRHARGDIMFRDAGWHFSYLGDIKLKIDSYAHTEYSKPPFNVQDNIDMKKNDLKDLFNRKFKFEIINDLSFLPRHVLENIDSFSEYIHTE